MTTVKLHGEIILFQSDEGQTKIQVRFEDHTVWLTQRLMADLFQVSVKTINEHIQNIYREEELSPEATIRKFRIVQQEASRAVERLVDHYNLDTILAVGYRVRSNRGAQFRNWASAQLKELLVKGFVIDDERLKSGSPLGADYFDELLARIRDIRSSEKMFWRKVLDIYATSVDYDPSADLSQRFFATLQNKMHWAAHGNTAAEVIVKRVDATKPNIGLTSWTGHKPKKSDVAVAKNFLEKEELDALNRIVSAYLELAELQAKGRRPMYMKDWIIRLDEFLRLSDREILSHTGKISHEFALAKAEQEFEKYRSVAIDEKSFVEEDFEAAVSRLKQLKPRKSGGQVGSKTKKKHK